jgi:hypothetical protein
VISKVYCNFSCSKIEETYGHQVRRATTDCEISESAHADEQEEESRVKDTRFDCCPPRLSFGVEDPEQWEWKFKPKVGGLFYIILTRP